MKDNDYKLRKEDLPKDILDTKSKQETLAELQKYNYIKIGNVIKTFK